MLLKLVAVGLIAWLFGMWKRDRERVKVKEKDGEKERMKRLKKIILVLKV